MKKICFLSGCLDNPGGTERVGITIANELSKKYEIHIISLSRKESPYFSISDKVNVHYLELSSSNNKRNYLKICYLIFKILKKHDIDILIEIDLILRIYTFPIQLILKKLKIVSWEHFYYGENLGVKLRSYCRKIATRNSDLIVTLTKKDLEIYSQYEKIKKKILAIPNPLDKNIIEKSSLINKKIICVGRLTYQKGFDKMIEGSTEFFKKFTDWTINIYGEGEDKAKLLEIIKKNKLEKNIILNKPTRDIYKEYLKSTIFLLPSRFEPFGMVLIEAMSCGLIPIAFESLGPNEIISHEKDGFLIPNQNIEAMFETLEKIIRNKDQLLKISNNTKIKTKKYYLEKIIVEWEKAIDDL